MTNAIVRRYMLDLPAIKFYKVREGGLCIAVMEGSEEMLSQID